MNKNSKYIMNNYYIYFRRLLIMILPYHIPKLCDEGKTNNNSEKTEIKIIIKFIQR